MKYTLLLVALSIFSTNTFSQKSQLRLPNGWGLSPAGKQIDLGDLPLNLATSKDGKWMAVTNNGQSRHSLQLIQLSDEKIKAEIELPMAWYGLTFSTNSKYLFASAGNENKILKFDISQGGFNKIDSFVLGSPWPNKIGPAGIALDEKSHRIYVVTKEDNSLYIIDSKSKSQQKFSLGSEAYSCVLSPDGNRLYISVWGKDQLQVWDTRKQQEIYRLSIGDNPNEMLLTRNGKYLYVANANDNSVAVVDTEHGSMIEVLNAALYPNAPNGSTTNGLALSSDEKKLYVANADNNCLAVFDVSEKGHSRGMGFIPTGWYPTNVKLVGKKIYVSNGKGHGSMANPFGPNPVGRDEEVNYQKSDNKKPVEVQYIGSLFKGSLSIINTPSSAELDAYTKMTYRNTPYSKQKELMAEGEQGNPIPMKLGASSPIKHVFYIIKENRTYDQVLGDLPQGNGDTSLVLFGRKITPNQHALAEEFVLLDNFYVDAEVSADGHNWSLSAYADDYTEKTWPTNYGGRGGTYDYEGQKQVSIAKGGFIWDHCLKAGISYRTYGEFADDYKANIPSLEGKFCPYYTSWDQSVRDTTRVAQWRRDFDSLLALNAVPALNTFRIINDHTEGLSLGRPTPFAHVADNDYAVGLLVDYLSKSPIWKESVVFILEDDAQNGPDHVDAHRSPAFVIGPYVKRHFVDHTPYTTSGMLRTIGLILGMPPMSQYDAAATPMWRCFSKDSNTASYKAILPQTDITAVNKEVNALSKISAGFDFSKEDRIPDLLFSEVIWKAVKGINSKMPAPRRSAFVMVNEEEDDD